MGLEQALQMCSFGQGPIAKPKAIVAFQPAIEGSEVATPFKANRMPIVTNSLGYNFA
jgi:hypothetical protein